MSQSLSTKVIEILIVFIFVVVSRISASDQAIIDKMFETYNLDTTSYEIEILTNNLKSENITSENIRIKPLSQKEPLGLYTAIIKVIDGDKDIESSQVRLRIKRYADVLVADDRIKRGDIIDEKSLSIKRVDITNLLEKPLKDYNELEGMRAKRNLKRGSVITSGALESIPDIKRGREISIIYYNGLCRISATGIALQEGIAGDYVKVKNKSSGKIIIARIVDQNAVSVE